ncbi:SGNH/GDSL hydrolase family protein [Reyranella sp.]|uniref:SGNH/GDSL hydrolase family protein n=1 Tax=Reyranella sp. TaxID=1929291 RepID=UPI003D0CB580
MKQAILNHFGLTKPYRFERTSALVAALVLAAVLGAGTILILSRGGDEAGGSRGLSWGTPRGWYFLYLGILVVAGAALAAWPRIATFVLSLAAVEMGLGFGAAFLYLSNLAGSSTLFPNNYNRPLYGWHPLLQAQPLPSTRDSAGRPRVFINSERMRGPERSPDQLKDKIVVALFGGSTTLDFASPDGESWGDRLEQNLKARNYVFINHGAPGYTTAEHVIQTAFYEQAFETPPHCAVYYIGWNDITNAHVDGLDSGYADYHMRGQIDFLAARRLQHPLISVSPVLSLLARFAVLAFDTARPAEAAQGHRSAAPDPRLDRIFVRNVGTISAINRQRGITTIWAGQVMNIAQPVSVSMRGWVALVPDAVVWPLIKHLNLLLEQQAGLLGDTYVDIPADRFAPEDFIDEGHFSPGGSMKFAALLAPGVAKACK